LNLSSFFLEDSFFPLIVDTCPLLVERGGRNRKKEEGGQKNKERGGKKEKKKKKGQDEGAWDDRWCADACRVCVLCAVRVHASNESGLDRSCVLDAVPVVLTLVLLLLLLFDGLALGPWLFLFVARS
jgi:hypothetical protein